MTASNLKWNISEKIGSISGIGQISSASDCIIILGHGAGAGMSHPFMETIAHQLFLQNLGVIRYQFPYMEQGKKRPDPPAVAQKSIQTVVHQILDKYALPVFLAGKSFGGRMASQWISKQEEPKVKGLIFYGFPLHSFAKINTDRAEHLYSIKIPMLFLQGTKDKLAKQELITEVTDQLPSAELKFFNDADHSFKVPKRTGFTHEEVITQLAQETRHWINKIL